MINPIKLMKLKSSWDRFTRNHPKLPGFIHALHQCGITEGTVLELKVISPNQEELISNIRIQADDIALFQELKELAQDS